MPVNSTFYKWVDPMCLRCKHSEGCEVFQEAQDELREEADHGDDNFEGSVEWTVLSGDSEEAVADDD